MSRLPRLLTISALVTASYVGVDAADRASSLPGRPATPSETASRDITIFPDGAGLPAGQGTARVGQPIYQAQCSACHGAKGEGTDNFPALVGGRGTLGTEHPELTVGSYWPYATTLWDYIHRAMPYPQPGSLANDEVYSLTAYVLFMNGIVADDAVIDRVSLPRVVMPNRNGFVPDGRLKTSR